MYVCVSQKGGGGLPDELEQKKCSEHILANGMGLYRAPIKFQKFFLNRPNYIYKILGIKI